MTMEKMVSEAPASASDVGRNLGQPNRNLDRLDLTKERPHAAEFVMPPMLEQARGFWCYLPVIRISQFPPLINLEAKLIDDGCRVVLLLVGGKPLALIK